MTRVASGTNGLLVRCQLKEITYARPWLSVDGGLRLSNGGDDKGGGGGRGGRGKVKRQSEAVLDTDTAVGAAAAGINSGDPETTLTVLSFLRDALGGSSDPDPLPGAKAPLAHTSGGGSGGGGGGRGGGSSLGRAAGTERGSAFSMSTLSRGVRSSSGVSRPSGVSAFTVVVTDG